MVYNKQFVVVVKCNDKILRERDEIVNLPFGSEYSLLLKNLSSRRASVNISIDGRDVLYNHSLILDTEKETEILGFLQGSTVKNRFKFIQKTKQIQDYRGDKIDDGLIRIEFAFEKKKKPIRRMDLSHYHYHYYPPVIGKDINQLWDKSGTGDAVYGSSNTTLTNKGEPRSSSALFSHQVGSTISESNVTMDSLSEPAVDEGITVEGSKVTQDFKYASIGTLDDSEVIIFKLRGIESTGKTVTTPLTVKTKLNCHTCGQTSKSNAKFCSGCGTSLEV
jgi:hypothetical protein